MKMDRNTFSNGEITVTYEPKICTHSDRCCQGLSEVFQASVIPWIDLEAASTLNIIKQIKKCPSGALSYCHTDTMELVK